MIRPIRIIYGEGSIFFKEPQGLEIQGFQFHFTGRVRLELKQTGDWVTQFSDTVALGYYNSLEAGQLENVIATYAGDMTIRSFILCDKNSWRYPVILEKISGDASSDKIKWSDSTEKVESLMIDKNKETGI